MRYLQKVIALLETQEFAGELRRLGISLQAQGVRFYLTSKPPYGTDFRNDTTAEGVLWITDCAEWAGFLLEQKEAVCGFLHEKNREQAFGRLRYVCEKPSELDASYLDRVYRRYHAIPWEILETPRCLVRESTPEDVPAFYEIYAEKEITRYMEALFPQKEQEMQYIRDYQEKIYAFYGFGIWTVCEKESGSIIGRAGLSYREGFEEPELGFVIGVPWQRRGYAEEVCRAILSYGLEELGFEQVQAFVMPPNQPSEHLCQKLGFHKKEQVCLDNILYNRWYYVKEEEACFFQAVSIQ